VQYLWILDERKLTRFNEGLRSISENSLIECSGVTSYPFAGLRNGAKLDSRLDLGVDLATVFVCPESIVSYLHMASWELFANACYTSRTVEPNEELYMLGA